MGEIEPVAWGVLDPRDGVEGGWTYVADWRDAAHDHIKDAMMFSELEDIAKDWVVRPLYAEHDIDRITSERDALRAECDRLRAALDKTRAETIEECASLVDDIPGIDLIEVSAAIRALGEAVR